MTDQRRLHPTTSNKRAKILDASYRANRAADALRYLDSAVSNASEAGLKLAPLAVATARADLMVILKRDAVVAGFKAEEFYSTK